MIKLPSIPAISSRLPPELSALLRPMREILLEFTVGGNKIATIKALSDAGLIKTDTSGTIKPSQPIDSTPPPAPTGLTAGGALATMILSWDDVASRNVAYTEVWRADSDSFALAQLIGRADGRIYTDSIGGGAVRYYWIRYVSLSNINGPFNAQAGTRGETGYDASYLISVLAANPPAGSNFNKLLFTLNSATTINGVYVPAGTYMSDAYIANGSITNVKIGDATIESAKIVSLQANKIVATTLAAISANLGSITSGDVYGTVIHGGAGYPHSGYSWPSNGGTGFHLSALGLLIGNASSGKYFQVDTVGNIYAPQFSIVNGVATFSGALSAASGTFSGDVTTTGILKGQGNTSWWGGHASVIGDPVDVNSTGVYGHATDNNGIYGLSEKLSGVYGRANGVGATNGSGIQGYGLGNAYGGYFVSVSNSGLVGISQSGWGVYGNGTSFDFYAAGVGANYGPFTGSHDGLISPLDEFSIGDILVDISIFHHYNVSNTIANVAKSTSAAQKNVIGVYVARNKLTKDATPSALKDLDIDEIALSRDLVILNAVGEGQINVCGEGGNLEAGDLIVSSSTAGKGMKQSDNIVRSCTVAKCRENVAFNSPTEIKMVACIYLCG
jgi:hypothetical protein